jgi:hypothetical protein
MSNAILLKLIVSLATAAYPMVGRIASDTYGVPGVGIVHTQGCYVSANAGDWRGVKLQVEDGRAWLRFVGDEGVEESCQIVKLQK